MLKSISKALLGTMFVIMVISLLLSFWYNWGYALDFIKICLVNFNGLVVGAFGYGFMHFITTTSRLFSLSVDRTISGNGKAPSIDLLEKANSHKSALFLTMPITVIGTTIAFLHSVPHYGASYVIITFGISSVYYTGAYLLYYFLTVIRAFNQAHLSMNSVKISKADPIQIENLGNYLTLTTTIGVICIYTGFRGTLTAGFTMPYEWTRFLLTTPLILFLPITLLYNFYPRHVLRRLLQHQIFSHLRKIEEYNKEELSSVFLEIKDITMTYAKILPFFDFKTLPSYLIGIAFLVSLVEERDPVVQEFIKYFFK